MSSTAEINCDGERFRILYLAKHARSYDNQKKIWLS